MFLASCSRKYICRTDEDTTDRHRYTSVGLFPVFYVGWKIAHKTKIIKPSEIDLRHNLAPIEEYERNYVSKPPAYVPCLDQERRNANKLAEIGSRRFCTFYSVDSTMQHENLQVSRAGSRQTGEKITIWFGDMTEHFCISTGENTRRHLGRLDKRATSIRRYPSSIAKLSFLSSAHLKTECLLRMTELILPGSSETTSQHMVPASQQTSSKAPYSKSQIVIQTHDQ